jgi:hypothetical protein
MDNCGHVNIETDITLLYQFRTISVLEGFGVLHQHAAHDISVLEYVISVLEYCHVILVCGHVISV